MQVINQYQLEKLHFPVDGYEYIVNIWRSVDGGQTFYYCGNSKYFRTATEAAAYIDQKERENV